MFVTVTVTVISFQLILNESDIVDDVIDNDNGKEDDGLMVDINSTEEECLIVEAAGEDDDGSIVEVDGSEEDGCKIDVFGAELPTEVTDSLVLDDLTNDDDCLSIVSNEEEDNSTLDERKT